MRCLLKHINRLVFGRHRSSKLIDIFPCHAPRLFRPMTSLKNNVEISRPDRSYGNFDLLKHFKLDEADITLSKWKSRVTGLSVVHLDYQAPIVNGYFTVATEIFDDSGCPHTLEHLVFMGSEKCPYPGGIDHIARRCFSEGTNAWTATDHTTYTVDTAGGQGFLQILPGFVDHILYPTLTDAAYLTEVHHINGKGEDAGVVYTEMQGRETMSYDILDGRVRQLMYPVGSGYRSETGGLTKALRVLTAEQVRGYHSAYYCPYNLCLIVAGRLPEGTPSLLQVIQEQVEPSIIAHGLNQGPRPPNWKRPFLETSSAIYKPLSGTTKETVTFPEKDETVGEIFIQFHGPAPNNVLDCTALSVLEDYLTSSVAAPLNQEYIEIESPLCTEFEFDQTRRASTIEMRIRVANVPLAHLETFDERLKATFERLVKEGIDMKRMSIMIDSTERLLRSQLESPKGETFSEVLIDDFLYGPDDGSELETQMNDIKHFAKLRSWSKQQWTDLLQKYYLDAPRIVLCGKPSAIMAEELQKAETARLVAQIEGLGPERLERAAKALEAAVEENEKPMPESVLNLIPVPDVKDIAWIPVQSVQEPGVGRCASARDSNPTLAEHLAADGEELPFFVQYDHIKSDFVTVDAVFALNKVPVHLRPYLSIYAGTFFSLPVKTHTGECLSYEEVANRLEDETVTYGCDLGISGQFKDTFNVLMRVELAKYEKAVAWIKDLAYGSEFNIERLRTTVAIHRSNIIEAKRYGSVVLGAVAAEVLHTEDSTSRATNVLKQAEFLDDLATKMQETPDEVISLFEELRKFVTAPSGIRFSVKGNILDMERPRSTWAKHFGGVLPKSNLDPVPMASHTLSEMGKNPAQKAIITSLVTSQNSDVQHTTKGIQRFDDPDYPALKITELILNGFAGQLWRSVRGRGFAYGCGVDVDLEAGLLSYSVWRASHPIQAFEEAAKLIKSLADGSLELDNGALEAAKSTIVYNVARRLETAKSAAAHSFIEALMGVPKDWEIKLLDRYQAVTKEDVLRILRRYYLPLFDPERSIAMVVAPPANAEQIGRDLAAAGFDVSHRTVDVRKEDENDSIASCSESDSSAGDR